MLWIHEIVGQFRGFELELGFWDFQEGEVHVDLWNYGFYDIIDSELNYIIIPLKCLEFIPGRISIISIDQLPTSTVDHCFFPIIEHLSNHRTPLQL